MKKLTSILIFCLFTLITKSQTLSLSTLIRFVDTPIPELTEEIISIDGWEFSKSELIDSIATLQFDYRDTRMLVKKVKNNKNEISLICNKQKYDELYKALLALKPILKNSDVDENGHIVKTFAGEKYGYSISISPKSVFGFQVYDLLSKQVMALPKRSAPIEISGFGETPFSLGRFSDLVPPTDDGTKTGKIAVRVSIDKSGKVIGAVAGVKGTTISDRALWEKCKQAILGARLSESDNLPSLQIGVVVFNFKVK